MSTDIFSLSCPISDNRSSRHFVPDSHFGHLVTRSVWRPDEPTARIALLRGPAEVLPATASAMRVDSRRVAFLLSHPVSEVRPQNPREQRRLLQPCGWVY